jgi:hypothetical protein
MAARLRDARALFIEPRGAVVFSRDARHHWTHAIPARMDDQWQGQHVRRSRRVSLTFRKMMQTGREARTQ